MAYDLLIKNGLIVDGSGMPAFRGDIGIKNGKIVDIGKLSGTAGRTVDAEGRARRVDPRIRTNQRRAFQWPIFSQRSL